MARSKIKTTGNSKLNESTAFPDHLLTKNDATGRSPSVVNDLVSGSVWVVSNVLSASECQAWVDHMEAEATNNKKKLDYVNHPATRYIAQRECFRLERYDPSMAERLFERIKTACPQLFQSSLLLKNSKRQQQLPIACNPKIRLYKYTKGMSFGPHIDESNQLPGLGTTRLTVLFYLTSCRGGATSFQKGRKWTQFVPVQGSMLLHIHGDDCLVHQGEPVQDGTKYILRTDLVYPSNAS